MKVWIALLAFSVTLLAQDNKPRVYITDSRSWEVGGGGGGTDGSFGSSGGGGARPQTAEIIKTFNQRCPAVLTNNIKNNTDYVVLIDHEGGKSFFEHDNKVAVFERVSGDTVVSKSTVSLGGSVQAACDAITAHWTKNGGRMMTARSQTGEGRPAMLVPGAASKISILSTPEGADIEVDGSFVGSTPSAIELVTGDHEVVVRKAGYKDWRRKMRVSGGDVKVVADLEKAS